MWCSSSVDCVPNSGLWLQLYTRGSPICCVLSDTDDVGHGWCCRWTVVNHSAVSVSLCVLGGLNSFVFSLFLALHKCSKFEFSGLLTGRGVRASTVRAPLCISGFTSRGMNTSTGSSLSGIPGLMRRGMCLWRSCATFRFLVCAATLTWL